MEKVCYNIHTGKGGRFFGLTLYGYSQGDMVNLKKEASGKEAEVDYEAVQENFTAGYGGKV